MFRRRTGRARQSVCILEVVGKVCEGWFVVLTLAGCPYSMVPSPLIVSAKLKSHIRPSGSWKDATR